MSELTGVGAKVESLLDLTEKLTAKTESQATQIAALEIKAASAGKLGLSEMVKIGGLVISLTVMISSLIQVFVKGSQAEALREVREAVAGSSADMRSLGNRVTANEGSIKARQVWMQEAGGDIADLKARVVIVERMAATGTGERWTSGDHDKYDQVMRRELDMIWKKLDEAENGGGQ